MEPVEFPGANVHIHRVEELIAPIPALALDSVNQRRAPRKKGVGGQLQGNEQVGHGLQLHDHEAVEKDVCCGVLGPAEAGGVVVHADHDVVMPHIQPAALVEIGLVISEVTLQGLDKRTRPFPVALFAGDERNLPGQERLVHVHAHALPVLHDQVGLGPLGYLDHHGNVSVGLLVVDEIAHVALRVQEDAPVQLLREQVGHAEQPVHRPEGVPVPHVAVIDGAGVDEGIADKAAGLLEHGFRVRLNELLQQCAVIGIEH